MKKMTKAPKKVSPQKEKLLNTYSKVFLYKGIGGKPFIAGR